MHLRRVVHLHVPAQHQPALREAHGVEAACELRVGLDEVGEFLNLLGERRGDGCEAVGNVGAHDVKPWVGFARCVAQALHSRVAAGVAHSVEEDDRFEPSGVNDEARSLLKWRRPTPRQRY